MRNRRIAEISRGESAADIAAGAAVRRAAATTVAAAGGFANRITGRNAERIAGRVTGRSGAGVRRFATLLAFAVLVAACEREPTIPLVPTPPEPPAGYKWSELPEIPDILPSSQVVVTHFFENAAGKRVRNFTLFYDKGDKLSYWVAYPLHSIYFGSYGRLDNFTYDPQIPSSDQMPITTGGYGLSGYDRGHQIASADRTVTRTANDQTFFVTNMTPQNSTLNQGQWADLENWARTKSRASGRRDTLYVVTGCLPGERTVTKNGVKGNIPDAYFKVFLRTKSKAAVFPAGEDAECIGVLMDNAAPSGSWKNYLKSVAEIEQLTGHKFFPAVSESVKETYSAADWGIY